MLLEGGVLVQCLSLVCSPTAAVIVIRYSDICDNDGVVNDKNESLLDGDTIH